MAMSAGKKVAAFVGLTTMVNLISGCGDDPSAQMQAENARLKQQNTALTAQNTNLHQQNTALSVTNQNLRVDMNNDRTSPVPDYFTQVVKMENRKGGVSVVSPGNSFMHRDTQSVITTIGRDCNFDIPRDSLGDDDWAEIDRNPLWNDPNSVYYNTMISLVDGDCKGYNTPAGHEAAAKAIDRAMRDAKTLSKDTVKNYLINFEKAANGEPDQLTITRVINADADSKPEDRKSALLEPVTI